MTIEIYSLIIQGVSGFLVAIGLFYAGKQISLLKESHKQDHDWNRRIASQEAIMNLNKLTPINVKINQIFEHTNTLEAIPLEKVLEAFDKDMTLEPEIHELLNSYEALARGLIQGIYDEEILYEGRRTAMIKMFDQFFPYIRHRRKNIHITAYNLTETIVNRWKARMSQNQDREKLGNLN